MYARSTTVLAHLDSIATGVTHMRDDVLPTLLDVDGCIGLSMLADRRSGRCIATSAWRTREAMLASEPQLRPVREHAAEVLGARPQVDEWEIAVLHRNHTSDQGACVRATWVRMAPEQADRVVDVYRMGLLPVMEGYDGFCSASLLLDRESGLAVSSVTYDGADAMARSRDQADALRESGAREAGVEIVDMCEFELALAHLRVPEMT